MVPFSGLFLFRGLFVVYVIFAARAPPNFFSWGHTWGEISLGFHNIGDRPAPLCGARMQLSKKLNFSLFFIYF